MKPTDVSRTDESDVPFLRGWAVAFPEPRWIAGADRLNRPPKFPAVRLKAARQSWSGPAGTVSAHVAASYDVHLECDVDEAGVPRGTLKLHMETNPYGLEKRLGCSPNKASFDCEVCQRRLAARKRLVDSQRRRLGEWREPAARDKLVLLKLPLSGVPKHASASEVASYLRSVLLWVDDWVAEAILAWKSWRA
jgi:hypothetical protein